MLTMDINWLGSGILKNIFNILNSVSRGRGNAAHWNGNELFYPQLLGQACLLTNGRLTSKSSIRTVFKINDCIYFQLRQLLQTSRVRMTAPINLPLYHFLEVRQVSFWSHCESERWKKKNAQNF